MFKQIGLYTHPGTVGLADVRKVGLRSLGAVARADFWNVTVGLDIRVPLS